jgi:hypothetical protein
MTATKPTILQPTFPSPVNPNNAVMMLDVLAAMALSNQVAQTIHVVLTFIKIIQIFIQICIYN